MRTLTQIQLRKLAGKIPCELCLLKGGDNIEADGGCRHRPALDHDLTDAEVVSRLHRAVEFFNDK